MEACRPRFFVIRKGIPRRIVPLVAADELPEWIRIIGCPRELKPEEASGLYNLGDFCGRSKEPYSVEIVHELAPAAVVNQTQDSRNVAAEQTEQLKPQNAMDVSEKGAAVTPAPSLPRHSDTTTSPPITGSDQPTPTASVRPIEETKAHTAVMSQPRSSTIHETSSGDVKSQDVTIQPALGSLKEHNITSGAGNTGVDANKSKPQALTTTTTPVVVPPTPKPTTPLHPAPALTGLAASKHAHTTTTTQSILPSSPPPLKSPPPSPNLIYCRHWIHHGTCKYGQACKYKHVMPTSPSTISALGLAEFPPWFTLGAGTAAKLRRKERRDLEVVARMLVGEILGGGNINRGKRGGSRKNKKAVMQGRVRGVIEEEDEREVEEEEEEEEMMQIAMGRVEADLPVIAGRGGINDKGRGGGKLGLGVVGRISEKLVDV
ncbi:hypothetical protein QBC43DRAFT_358858 [Cladorrhinum sp. PSN259]|nr:hypothetical protein QBC43DRAFT_358858 [Cladorrhinum sp. PSN259]